MSLLYALETLPERRLAPDSDPLEDLPSLNIHVINFSPLFDSKTWELFSNIETLSIRTDISVGPFNLHELSTIKLFI